ncbi:MAG: AAA family ATPase [Dehalococcoidia bacterium]
MILKKLILKNFRQFKGTQEIEFAFESDSNGRNVTVIFGQNGRGKTGIFRAIMFCLYGEHLLSQDEGVAQKELHLINQVALDESASDTEAIEASVEVKLRHNGGNYSVKRTLLGVKDGAVEPGILRLSHTDADGNTHNYEDPEKIKELVNQILDKNIREYFLFDGEKIERLTRASVEQRKEISKGIRNLLNVDALEKAVGATQRLKKKLSQELAKKATGNFGKVVHQIVEMDEKISQLKTSCQSLEEEYVLAGAEKKQVDIQMEAYTEIRSLLRERRDKENELQSQQDQAKALLLDMKSRIGKSSQLLISDTVEHVFKQIDAKKQKGEIPSEIRQDLIEKLLSDHLCICRRELIPDTEPFKQIILWRDKLSKADLDNFALDLWRYLSGIRSHNEDIAGIAETLLVKYGSRTSTIESLRSRIEKLNSEIGTSERKDAAELETQRARIEEKMIRIEARRRNEQGELAALESEMMQLAERRKSLEKEEQAKSELSERATLAEGAVQLLQTVYEEFSSEIKVKIAHEANLFFEQLLDREGRETLKEIVVNSDYSLQVLDRWGKPFLADISAGQRQIMSISLIAALAKVASVSEVMEIPLFMDTPFSRLSWDHRRNLINVLPRSCAQWILLVTDTEFSQQEASLLKQSGRWGEFYELQSKGAGFSTIIKRDIPYTQLNLRESLEAHA